MRLVLPAILFLLCYFVPFYLMTHFVDWWVFPVCWLAWAVALVICVDAAQYILHRRDGP